jgi:protease-4
MKITLLVVLIFVVVASFYYLIFSSYYEGSPTISRNSYLLLNIYGEVPERADPDAFEKIFTGEFPSMAGLLHCIRKAKIDRNIRGLVLRPMGSGLGWAKIEEIKQALRDFKSSGKPVYIYLEMGGNREYYLSTEADMIFGSPTGMLLINGLLGSRYYIKGSLTKLGVEADFVTHGKYKSAPDIFTQEKMSIAEREEVNSILDDFFSRYVSDISSNRELDKDEVTTLINQGVYTLEKAFEKNLIDTLMYFNEFKEYLKEGDDNRIRFVTYSRYKKVPLEKLGVKAKQSIALIYCIGDIISGIGDETQNGFITSQGMANVIQSAAKNKKLKAIVLRIDSPGGSGIASDIIWREIEEARKIKPVIISMSDIAASGGYYIAMTGDSIIAQASSIVGSIGVYAGKFSMNNLYRKIGIKKEEIPRGKNANLFSETQIFSEKQRQLLQDGVDEFYRRFVENVAQGRNMTYEEIDKIAQGRVWTGSQSLANGLIDKIGGLHDAIQIAKKMIGVAPDDYVRVQTYPRYRSFLNKLLSTGIQAKYDTILDIFNSGLRTYLQGFFYYQNYEPLLIMPYYLVIN